MYDMGIDADQQPQGGQEGFDPFQGFTGFGGAQEGGEGFDWINNMMNDMFGRSNRREHRGDVQQGEDIHLRKN